MKRGDVWLCALDPTVGSQIRETRPCLIVSPDALNHRLRTVIVTPLTTGGQPAPFRVPVKFGGVNGLVLPDQTRTLDRKRLIRLLGTVDNQTLTATLTALTKMFLE